MIPALQFAGFAPWNVRIPGGRSGLASRCQSRLDSKPASPRTDYFFADDFSFSLAALAMISS